MVECQTFGGRVAGLRSKGLLVLYSLEALCYVLEQDSLFSA